MPSRSGLEPASNASTLPVVEHTLDNGLKVLIREVHTAPLASVWCWYRVGSKDEGPGLTGVSHWCEHMNFRGTTRIPREAVKGIIEQFGGFWNGYTWIDQTAYVETASADALDRMLFIEAERMAHCLYHPDDCEAERTVIISELQGGENDPDELLDHELTAAALRAHPYRHPTIGWLPDLQSMTRDDLYGYYRRFYVPNNATLVVVGDVDARDALALIRRHFDPIPRSDLPRRAITREPDHVGERRVTIARPGTTGYVKLAFPAPAFTELDFYPLLVLDAVLTGAKGLSLWASFRTPAPQRRARLYRALVDGGLAASVQGALLPTEHPFLYSISLTASDGIELARLENAALEALARVRREGVTDAELVRAKKQLFARLVFENDSVTNVAHQLGYFETLASWRALESMRPSIEAVTAADVGRVAGEYLADTRRSIGWFAPTTVPATEEGGEAPE
ncbi:MAG: insulinase family protein [Acidimicrobiia bacterium]|nr:insulinase family protein [Acidimicrobiia bacterium]